MNQMGKIELNRKTYKNVKRMDHAQMNTFCEGIYMKGYEEGKNESAGLSESEILQAVLCVKGIGEKKANDIVAALTQKQHG